MIWKEKLVVPFFWNCLNPKMLSNKSQTRNNFSFCFCFGQAGQTASVAVENCLSHTKKSISFVLFVKKKKCIYLFSAGYLSNSKTFAPFIKSENSPPQVPNPKNKQQPNFFVWNQIKLKKKKCCCTDVNSSD